MKSDSSSEIILQESSDDDDTVNTSPLEANDLQNGNYIITKVKNVGRMQPFMHFVGTLLSRYE